MPRIKVPAALAGGSGPETVEVTGTTLAEALADHAAEHGPELQQSVVEDGELREYINVFIDGTEAEGLSDELEDDSLIRVMPAASGGQSR